MCHNACEVVRLKIRSLRAAAEWAELFSTTDRWKLSQYIPIDSRMKQVFPIVIQIFNIQNVCSHLRDS